MKDIQNLNVPGRVKKKVSFYLAARKIVFCLFAAYLISGILIGWFTGISLTLDYPKAARAFLYGLLIIGFSIQVRLYVLYRRIGYGADFLKERATIMAAVVLIFVFYFTFTELRWGV